MFTISRCAASAISVAVASLAGCYASVDPPPPVAYTETTAAPVDIETYPSVVYLGEPVYFDGDRWWHRDGPRWTYYRSEPAELHARRELVRRVPRARSRAAPRAEAPREERHEERR
jgi:hypothetical protein